MKIFWCWQSDTDQSVCRYFIRDALQAAIDEIAGSSELDERPEIDHDTKDVAGMPDIVATIFEKIDSASVIVADLTTVARTSEEKAVANPNVLVELGYAKRALGATKIICVANEHWFEGPADLPFDLRNRRGPIQYRLEPDAAADVRQRAKRQLQSALKSALLLILKVDPEPPVPNGLADPHGRPSRDRDRSIWLPKGRKLVVIEHTKREITPYEGARAYARVVSNGWAGEPPTRNRLRELLTHDSFWAPLATTVGNYGLNEEGALKYWFRQDGGQEVAYSATQFFLTTGEIWTYAAPIHFDLGSRTFLRASEVCEMWKQAITKHVEYLDLLGARKPYGMELGAHGLTHLLMPAQFEPIRPLQDEIYVRGGSAECDAEAQEGIVERASSALADVYALPRSAIS